MSTLLHCEKELKFNAKIRNGATTFRVFYNWGFVIIVCIELFRDSQSLHHIYENNVL